MQILAVCRHSRKSSGISFFLPFFIFYFADQCVDILLKLKLEMNSVKVDIYETWQKKKFSERREEPQRKSSQSQYATAAYPYHTCTSIARFPLNSDLKFSLKITFTRICIKVIDKPGEGPLPGYTLHLLFLP